MLVLKSDQHVEQVIRLGDANARYLGHFPESCYHREASKGRILGAIGDDSRVLGYVLYRTTRERAVIQHLCVDEKERGKGVASALISTLMALTRHLPYIVCHCAREFPAYEAWRRLGFTPLAEKKGRGKEARVLTRFVLDQGHAHLFSAREADLATRIVAVMDANVAIALQDADPSDREILALTDDWLEEEVAFWVVDEAFVEIDRNESARERERRKSRLRTTPLLRYDVSKVDGCYAALCEVTGHHHRVQDRSDLLQLAQAISASADVFLTRDRDLLGLAERVAARFDIEVLEPVQLVLRLDEIARAGDYAPERLAGSAIECKRLGEGDLVMIEEAFLNHGRGERKHVLARRVRDLVSASSVAECMLVMGRHGNPAKAMVGFEAVSPHVSSVSLLRVRPDRLAETVTRHLLDLVVRRAVNEGRELVLISEAMPLHPIADAAKAMGFSACGERWVKWCGRGLGSPHEIASRLARAVSEHPEFESGLSSLISACENPFADVRTWASIERAIWPMRVRGSVLASFIVPIQPRWARHLFDEELGRRDLWGGDPTLVLNCENVYYRSSHAQVVVAPSRILWYVSQDQQDSVQEIRAVSSVIATDVAPAKELFRRYRRLGVYEWSEILGSVDGDPQALLMAIHFGPTERLPIPVPRRRMLPILDSESSSGRAAPLTAPLRVSTACFDCLYGMGHGNQHAS